ncbi:MAG TPA: PAS domain S-box protein, partial [Methanomicrobiales archaeon]|nr:PAS domain S-box protein [Methanomicrobiales archaeon]
MKIRTQLFIGLIVFALLLLIVSSLVITTNREVDRLNRGEALAQGIALKVGELGYLSNDYVLYREQLQADRWESKYASISADVANLSVNTPEQLAIVGGLQANLRNLRSIFDDLVSTPAAPAQAGGGPDPAFIQLSWSRLAIQNQGMVFDAGRLSDILRDEANTVKMENSLLTVSLMVLCSVFLLTSYLLFYRRALRSIAGLQEGAGVIGSGNLDHVIDVKGDDEISELSRAFNLMTASLKTVTAKKSDLEREMAERRQAEDALRENEARLRVLYESMTEGLAIHNVVYEGGDAVDYVVTDVNPAFEMITGLSRSVAVGRRATELYGTGSPPYLDVYSRVASGGAPEHFETYFPPMERHFAISVFSPGKGKFATVFTDITDRKRADEALRQLAQFPGQNPNPIMRITFEGALLYANPPAATWLGEMGWVEGEPVPAAVRTLVDSVGGDEYEHQTEITDRQGRVSWLVAVRPPGEAYVNVYGRDITLRKQVEEAIRQLNTELGRKADELLQANETLTASRKAALNLMEDAILARDALRESEARYRTVADNTYDWEFWIDPAGKFIYCSPSCEMITGRKADEFLADPDLRGKIIHPDDVPGFEEHQHEVHEKQGVGMGEWRYVRPDGTSCWVEHVCQPIYGAKGEFLGTRGSNRDITERKRAEVALQESERLLQDVMDGSPSPIFLKDRDGKFITINATLERMLGMSREAIKGKTDYDIAPGEVADYWQAHDSKVLGTGKAIQVEEVADLADGHHIFLANKFPLVDAGGEVYGVGAISHDITDRKRVEEALRESEERFRVLAEAMPQIVWSADASGSMDYYNQQAFVYGGVGLDEVKGWNWESLIHPDDLPATAAAWQKALGTGESSVIEHRLRRFDGEYRWHLTRGSPVRDEGGAIRRWIGTATDIHDLKRAEDALRESEERYRALVDSAPEAIIV